MIPIEIPDKFTLDWLTEDAKDSGEDICSYNRRVDNDQDMSIEDYAGCSGMACNHCICDAEYIRDVLNDLGIEV